MLIICMAKGTKSPCKWKLAATNKRAHTHPREKLGLEQNRIMHSGICIEDILVYLKNKC